MNFLVLDEAGVLPWLVGRLGGPDVRVCQCRSFFEAIEVARSGPIAAAIVGVPPARVHWPLFQRICATHEPPIPVLYVSSTGAGAAELGLEPLEGRALFITSPAPPDRLTTALGELVAAARAMRDAGVGAGR